MSELEVGMWVRVTFNGEGTEYTVTLLEWLDNRVGQVTKVLGDEKYHVEFDEIFYVYSNHGGSNTWGIHRKYLLKELYHESNI